MPEFGIVSHAASKTDCHWTIGIACALLGMASSGNKHIDISRRIAAYSTWLQPGKLFLDTDGLHNYFCC